MKFSLNGALTIGTLDGANVEIREEVGPESFFLFGLTIDLIASGTLSRGDAELFRPLVENLLDHDPFLVLADYQSYVEAQERVSTLWCDPQAWTRQSILNTARMGKFSSDRSIRDYCEQIWNIQPSQGQGPAEG